MSAQRFYYSDSIKEFIGKAGGLVVDYIGIAKALKEAMRDYTKQDQSNFGNPNIKDTALIEFQKHLEICRDFMHGYDYSGFHKGTDAQRAAIIKGGVNFMLAPAKEEQLTEFLKHTSFEECRKLVPQPFE